MKKILVVALVVMGIISCSEPTEIRAAKSVVSSSMSTPSTIRWLKVEVLKTCKTDSADWYIARARFDAQNAYGALIRNDILVCYLVKGNNVKWNPNFAVMDLNSSSVEELIGMPHGSEQEHLDVSIVWLEGENGWPKK